jgi:transcription-repair coupling factor (superfamily II helicase)
MIGEIPAETGQVFYFNNRIENIKEVAGMTRDWYPMREGKGHG